MVILVKITHKSTFGNTTEYTLYTYIFSWNINNNYFVCGWVRDQYADT